MTALLAPFPYGSPPRVGEIARTWLNDTVYAGSPPRVWGNRSTMQNLGAILGSPPRVWGNRQRRATRCKTYRFTPTCVGKSWPRADVPSPGSPPRVWGNRPVAVEDRVIDGSPPRVWGNPPRPTLPASLIRFTPTCVGKSLSGSIARHVIAVHPHVCGEIAAGPSAGGDDRFTPTCVGKSEDNVHSPRPDRFTPTCVGKSAAQGCNAVPHRRFTPTCVGKSRARRCLPSFLTVHPHVCGEIVRDAVDAVDLRFTPTCVGKSLQKSHNALRAILVTLTYLSCCAFV